LARNDEISSTERLLELIRDNSDTQTNSDTGSTKSLGERINKIFTLTLSFGKPATIGVDVGYKDLRLVKIRHTPRPELVDYVCIPYEGDLSPSRPEFYKFLKKSLTRFCGSGKSVEIWGNISSARVELRYLRIPKVPSKQIANAVYWSHKKVAPYDEKETIFDFEVIGDIYEEGTTKTAVVSFTAPKQEVQNLKELFAKSGFPLKGISIVPFAFQNLLRRNWIRSEAKNVSSLYIGRDWSRIDIFCEGNLVLSRGIKAGIKTMREAMRGELSDGSIDISGELAELQQQSLPVNSKTRTSIDDQKAQEIFIGLIHETSPEKSTQTDMEPQEEEIFNMILPALRRLVRQVERTFEHYATNFDNERVKQIYISSGLRPHRRIVEYIGKALGIARDSVDPFANASEFIKNVAHPDSPSERGSYAPSIGMALSKNSITPNFLHTFKEKAKNARSRLLNQFAFVGFVVVMALCFAFNWWQGHLIDQKKDRVARLQTILKTFKTRVDQNQILALVEKNKEKNEAYRLFSRKYMGVVVLSEISNLTPTNIRLISIAVELNNQLDPKKDDRTDKKQANNNPDRETDRNLVLEGYVFGSRVSLESTLAGYLINLKASPLFDDPVVDSKSMDYYNKREVLRFKAQLKLS